MKRFAFILWGPAILLVGSPALSSCQLWYQVFPPSVVGTWRQDVTYTAAQAGSSSNPTQFRFQLVLGSDNSIQFVVYVMQNSSYMLLSGIKGSYTTSNDEILNITQTGAYVFDYTTQTGQWVTTSGTGSAKYSILRDTMTLTVDYDTSGTYDTTHPITDTYPGGTGGPSTDITYTLTKVSS